MPLYFIYITLGLLTSLVAFTLLHFYKLERQHDKLVQIESRWTDINRLLNQLHDSRISDQRSTAESKEQLLRELNSYRQQFDQHQIGSLKLLKDSLQQGLQHISQRMDKLTEKKRKKLLSIRIICLR